MGAFSFTLFSCWTEELSHLQAFSFHLVLFSSWTIMTLCEKEGQFSLCNLHKSQCLMIHFKFVHILSNHVLYALPLANHSFSKIS